MLHFCIAIYYGMMYGFTPNSYTFLANILLGSPVYLHNSDFIGLCEIGLCPN